MTPTTQGKCVNPSFTIASVELHTVVRKDRRRHSLERRWPVAFMSDGYDLPFPACHKFIAQHEVTAIYPSIRMVPTDPMRRVSSFRSNL